MAALVKRYGKVLVVLVVILGLGVLVGMLVRLSPAQFEESTEEELVLRDPNTWVEAMVWSGRDPNDSELSGDFPIGDFLQSRQEVIFRNIMADKSGTSEALRAQSRLVNVLTKLGRSSEAQTELEAIITTHIGRERLPHTLSDMVRDAYRQGTSEVLGVTLAGVLDQNPSGTEALWLKMAVAENYVYFGRDEQVGPVVDRIIREHGDDPNAAEAVVQVAWRYRLIDKPDLARVYYEMALEHWPGNPRAIYHQRGLVYALLAEGDEDGAWAAVNNLLNTFEQDELVTGMIVHMARTYRKEGHPAQTQTLYEYLVQHYPDSPQALTAQHELVLLYLANSDEPALEQAITDLLSGYADEEDYAKDVCRVARHLEQAGKSSQSLYEAILSHCSERTDSLSTQLHVAIAHAAMGNSEACAATKALLLQDFGSDAKLPEALSTLAEAIYFRGQMQEKGENGQVANQLFGEAIAEWEDLIERFPEDKEVARAHLCLANTYQHLGDLRQALVHYEAVAWDWPDDSRAWHAQFMVGQCYEQLVLRGLEPRGAAATRIRNAYRAVVDVYPDSQVSEVAADRLQHWQNL